MDNRTELMSAHPLAPGCQVTWFTIKSVLGRGGFGVTYLAHDNNLKREVAIKEYLPTDLAHRKNDCSVNPISGDHTDQFAWGLDSFLKEAVNLAKFNHENIVRVHSVFEQNHTAYMVMEYEQGESLASLIARHGSIDQRCLQQIFFPILDGLEKIHDFGFIHRDIKPANIHVRKNGSPVLIDFGSARQASLQKTGDITTLITQGYTPLEQYSPNYGTQGPWTDIYALAATLYESITGSRPEDSISRSAQLIRAKPDRIERLQSAKYPGFDQAFLDAVNAGLALQPEDRPQSLSEWRACFDDLQTVMITNIQAVKQPARQASTNQAPANRAAPARPAAQPPRNPQEDAWDLEGATQSHQIINRASASKSLRIARAGIMGLIALSVGIGTSAYIFRGGPAVASFDPPVVNPEIEHQAPVPAGAAIEPNEAVEASDALESAETAEVSEPAEETETAEAIEPAEAVEATEAIEADIATEADVASATDEQSTIPEAAELSEPPQQVINFDTPLANDFKTDSPRSISMIIEGSPEFPPIVGLDRELWADNTCNDCHTWKRESLCEQGKFYTSHDDSRLARIKHPLDGLFKSALKQWAENGCQ